MKDAWFLRPVFGGLLSVMACMPQGAAATSGLAEAQVANAASSLPSHPYVIAQTYALQSQVLSEARELNIMLPEGYAEQPERRYPVIYLLDGGQQEDFTHMAGAVQFASFPWVERLPPAILVGIANTDRKRDMTFKPALDYVLPKWLQAYREAYKTAGGSEQFIRYLETEVQPFVAQNFRTGPDRVLIGQSLAGLLATEVLLKKPALFNHYVIMSPSLWWDQGSLLKQAPQWLKQQGQSSGCGGVRKVYLAVGKEGPEMERDTRALAALLRQQPPAQQELVFEYLPRENHGSILHPAALSAFAHLFAPQKKGR